MGRVGEGTVGRVGEGTVAGGSVGAVVLPWAVESGLRPVSLYSKKDASSGWAKSPQTLPREALRAKRSSMATSTARVPTRMDILCHFIW